MRPTEKQLERWWNDYPDSAEKARRRIRILIRALRELQKEGEMYGRPKDF